MKNLTYIVLGAGALLLLSKQQGLDGLGRTGYVPTGGRATQARARANISRSSSQQRNVHTAQRMRPGQTSAWSLTPQRISTPAPSATYRAPLPYQTTATRTPTPATPPAVAPRPLPPPPPRSALAPVVKAPPAPPKTVAPPTAPKTVVKQEASWYDRMRSTYGAPTISTTKTVPVKVAEKTGFKINPLVAGATALLVPIFGAMA